MKCLACDVVLNDKEATRKSPHSGMFYDLCDDCFSTIEDQVDSIQRSEVSDEQFGKEE